MFGRDRKALEALEKEVRDQGRDAEEIHNRLRSLESEMQNVTADSMLQWEKVNRAIGRLAKRTEAEATKQDGPTDRACMTEEEKNAIIRAGGDPWATRS